MVDLAIIGLMSGTSLDGVDLALCRFSCNGTYNYKIECADTFFYPGKLRSKLSQAHLMTGEELMQFHIEYGRILGAYIDAFIRDNGFEKDTIHAIASHGHTIFHQPEKSLTFQLGHGAEIAETTHIQTICDFRRADLAKGGQGAPLVPIGDTLLFGSYQYCLNIGGIANVSYDINGKRVAYDICPANMVLNYLAKKTGQEFDKNGEIARRGKVRPGLIMELNSLDYYQKPYPKSLGREWVEKVFFPIIDDVGISLEDKMATCVEHIALQVASETQSKDLDHKILVTGGGAHHKFLIERINNYTGKAVVLPGKDVIDFKEALVFAFLGYLRLKGKVNVLSSVTGAKNDHSSGIIYKPS